MVTPRGSVAIDTSAVPGMMELSGAAYRGSLGGSTHQMYAVQDSYSQLITLSFELAANGALTTATATATRTLAPEYDFEGLAIGPSGSILVADESTPAIRRYDATTGGTLALLAMPPVFATSRANFAFESLTRSPDGATYWTANEAALTTDGPIATTSQGTTVRLQRFDYDAAGTLTLGPQYAYAVDPIHIGTTVDSVTRSGLVDLVALPDSSLLVLERSLGKSTPSLPLYQYENRIYHVTFVRRHGHLAATVRRRIDQPIVFCGDEDIAMERPGWRCLRSEYGRPDAGPTTAGWRLVAPGRRRQWRWLRPT